MAFAALTVAMGLGSTVGVLAAEDVADFYRGRQMKIIVGAGGGYDTYARLVQRHIGRHIPGTRL